MTGRNEALAPVAVFQTLIRLMRANSLLASMTRAHPSGEFYARAPGRQSRRPPAGGSLSEIDRWVSSPASATAGILAPDKFLPSY